VLYKVELLRYIVTINPACQLTKWRSRLCCQSHPSVCPCLAQ